MALNDSSNNTKCDMKEAQITHFQKVYNTRIPTHSNRHYATMNSVYDDNTSNFIISIPDGHDIINNLLMILDYTSHFEYFLMKNKTNDLYKLTNTKEVLLGLTYLGTSKGQGAKSKKHIFELPLCQPIKMKMPLEIITNIPVHITIVYDRLEDAESNRMKHCYENQMFPYVFFEYIPLEPNSTFNWKPENMDCSLVNMKQQN
jgi:hypothetical protein